MSTRKQHNGLRNAARALPAARQFNARGPLSVADEIAHVATARRELLLRAHRFRLRREDLEDCYGQAVLELVVASRRGAEYTSRRHIGNALEQRFMSRIHDRRRALTGRSPIQSALEEARHIGDQHAGDIDVADRRPQVEQLVLLRAELRLVGQLARRLTPHQQLVLASAWARRYRAASSLQSVVPTPAADDSGSGLEWLAARTSTPVVGIAGSRAALASGDSHIALIPVQAPPVVQAMVVAGNELQELPYGPPGHPDPRNATEEDCSSTVNYVFYRSGVRPVAEVVRKNPLAQDYVHWGAPGPGRWVTIYATASPTPHVFAVIAGLRLDTSHDGTDSGPNRNQDGPRWRVLDHIPAWARWSVRHPRGL